MFQRKSVLAALLLGTAAIGTAQAAPLLHTEVEVERAFVQQSDDVHVRVTLTNNGSDAAQILKWQTPFWGVDDDMFQVGRNGEAVAYLGRHVKRAAPTEADFVTLAPGQSLSARVEMSALYDMSRSGEYTFQYAMSLQGLRASAVEVASNVASLFMEGDGPSPFPARVDVDADKALTPVYKNCSASRKTQLATALSSAETYSVNGYNYLAARTTTAQRNASTRYKTWFGTQTSSRWTSVQSHFNSIKNAIQTKTITFNCNCTDNYYAYVYPNSPYEIWLCNAFWSAPNTGTDSKAGTLVHELSHFNVVAGTDDWAYGQTACKSLATSNPNRATDNADSHEYFAENTPSLP